VGAKRPDFSRTARSGAPDAVFDVVRDEIDDVAGDVISDAVSGAVSGVVSGVVGDPTRNADSKDAVVTGKGMESESAATETGQGLAGGLAPEFASVFASELLTSLELAADELGLGLEVAVWREVACGLESEMMAVVTFELIFEMASEVVFEIDTATGVGSKVEPDVAPEFALGFAAN
jgi:hypothetical protein